MEQGVLTVLVQAYAEHGVAADQLPYTDDFERLYEVVSKAGVSLSKADLWRMIVNARKRGALPRLTT